MFPKPNLPDFDAMSQDELIEWLEALSRRQGGDDPPPASGDVPPKAEPADADLLPELMDEDEWQAWIDDEDLQQETPPVAKSSLESMQDLGEDDDETPPALPAIEEGVNDDTTDPLDVIEGIDSPIDAPATAEADASDGDGVDPLDWLERLANEVSDAAAQLEADDAPPALEDIDDAWEDDESLDDREDESLYSRQLGDSVAFLEKLLGMPLEGADEFGTQSMPPLPDALLPDLEDDAPPETTDGAPQPLLGDAASQVDGLTQAFLPRDHQADLEAWYAERLEAIADAVEAADQSSAPALDISSLKMPPPGLAAGFNSARSRIADDKLGEALRDYETLLRANIGLDLVVSDMQWLIAQGRYRRVPALHRVLGDALMRQGSLQEALAAYRQALKLL